MSWIGASDKPWAVRQVSIQDDGLRRTLNGSSSHKPAERIGPNANYFACIKGNSFVPFDEHNLFGPRNMDSAILRSVFQLHRSEERRVGKECRSRRLQDQ